MRWSADDLSPDAVGVSASRRTDIPALYGSWFERRLAAGYAEYIPAGPPRRVRRSLLPSDVTHFCFWSKWPRPFFRALDRVLAAGFPVIWNVSISGLGGSDVEPGVPDSRKVVAAVKELAERVPPAAVLWRYDPIFLSERFGAEHHQATFRRLAEALSGHVDRVAVSFVETYGRRVTPDLRTWEREHGDRFVEADLGRRVEIVERLRGIAAEVGLAVTTCCATELETRLGCAPAGCNRWAWVTRVYPELAAVRPLAPKPTRPGCACSAEVDIGVYDTCVLGCRYSYGSRSRAAAQRSHSRHDPEAACLVP